MYVFPEEIRKAYEAIPIPQVFYQLIDGKVVPLLVSDGFCRLVKLDLEEAIRWLIGGQFERMHPDDAGNVAHVSDDFAHHRSGYNVIFRARHGEINGSKILFRTFPNVSSHECRSRNEERGL